MKYAVPTRYLSYNKSDRRVFFRAVAFAVKKISVSGLSGGNRAKDC